MVVFDYGVVVRPVIRNDHAPPPSLASVLIRGVEKVAVEEDRIAGIELAIDAIELPLRPLHPLGVGSALGGVTFSNEGERVTLLYFKGTLSPNPVCAGSQWIHGPDGPSFESQTKLLDSRFPLYRGPML